MYRNVLFPLLAYPSITPAQTVEDIPLEHVSVLSDSIYLRGYSLRNRDLFGQSSSSLWASGEVVNGTGFQVYFVRLSFFAKGAQGEILGTDLTYARGETIIDLGTVTTDAIGPGDTGFFDTEIWRSSSEFTREQITALTLSIDFDKQVETLKGDLDGDGDVDFDDFFALADNFGREAQIPSHKPVASPNSSEQLAAENLVLRKRLEDESGR